MNIIILTENDKTDETTYIIKDERAVHIKNILKAKPGDVLEIGLLNHSTGKAKVEDIGNEAVKLKITDFYAVKNSNVQIELILALPRPQSLKKILPAIATYGIARLYLIRSEKVEKSYFQSQLLKEDNYIKYLLDGLSQGKRIKLPEVKVYKKFKMFFEGLLNNEYQTTTKLLAHPDAKNFVHSNMISKNGKTIVAIGPEGGWNNYEVNFMLEKGFEKIKLSENILRVETAVTAVLSQLELIASQKK